MRNDLNITRVQGILNGTTNYILTQMENGTCYSTVLEKAQACGYAEADPSGDVKGFNAVGKVASFWTISNLTVLMPG